MPKADGHINVGVGGKADKMKSCGGRLKDYWQGVTGMLDSEGLVHDVDYEPTGYSYYLRGNVDLVRNDNAFIVGDAVGLASLDMGEGIGPAVQSAILAADAIARNKEYDLTSLARFSTPGFFRKRGEQTRLSAIGDRKSVSLP